MIRTNALGYCVAGATLAWAMGGRQAALPAPAPPSASTPYEWNNVAIGGGGYVLDVVCHPREKDLVYIRTDVGGFYRWDAAKERWLPLTDAFNRHQSNYYGGEALALDPTNPDIVYIAAGKYTADWAPKGAIFKSTDRGRTWKKLPLEIKMGSNEDYRVCGQRLVVSPANPSVLLFGSRRDGLWRSEDAGASWARVGTFPAAKPGVGITALAFLPVQPGTVFAAAFGDGVYRSQDAGKTWEKTPGSGVPADVLRLAAAADGTVYATHEKGIAKWSEGHWTDTTPSRAMGPFAGLSIDPRDPKDILAAAQKDRLHLYRSRDGGKTWILKPFQTRSSVPWYPGHMKQVQYASGLTFDPCVSGRIWLTDWYATYRGDIGTDPMILESREAGHEEVVVFSLTAPPAGLSLLSGVADVDGFPHESLDTFPPRGLGGYYGGSASSFGDCYQLAWCVIAPLRMARVGGRRWDHTGGGAVSRDGGRTWSDFPTWNPEIVPARVALSATDPDNMVVLRIGSGPALFTRDGGKTWNESAELPSTLVHSPWNWQVPLAADGARSGVFYAFDGATLYRSDDGGAHFAPVSSGLSGGGGQNLLVTIPGRAGEVWLSLAGGGLRRSTDGGRTFRALPSVKHSHLFAAGKSGPASSTPILYLYGTLADSREGIFRSLDGGASWQPIQDAHIAIGDEPNSMTASYHTFGLVFIGTNGRGIYYGRPAQRSDVATAAPKERDAR